jgi:hypothetical protein
VTNLDGQKVYDLDLVQFNIDIPATVYSKENDDSIDYHLNMQTKSYITLQEKSDVGSIPYSDYVNIEVVGADRIVEFDSLNASSIYTTKFDIVDSTTLITPKTLGDFNDYYVTVHIEVNSQGIKTQNIKIKNMSLSSLSFNDYQLKKIGSPTGKSINPIAKNGSSYVYNDNIPLTIDNESGTYFYLTGNSGISILPAQNTELTKGVSFPINEDLKTSYDLVGIQMYLMFNENDSFIEEKVVGKFYNNAKEYDIVLTPETDGQRANIRIFDTYNELELEDLRFFQNGKEVSSIRVRPLEWNAILISLQSHKMPHNGISGNLEIYSGVRVNNVGFFTEINEVNINLNISNDWQDLLEMDPSNWANASVFFASSSVSSATWGEVLNSQNIPVVVLSVDGSELFETYSGLSYAVGDDSSLLNVNFDSIQVLNDASWDNFDIKPI